MPKGMRTPPIRCPDKCDTELVCAYDYRDEFGTLRFQKLRYRYLEPEKAGRPKTFRYWHGAWGKPDGADRLVYRLPELLDAIRGGERVLYIVEGEKDADTAARWGMYATSNHQAAGPGNKVTAEQAAWFQGYSGQVRIVVDKDTSGYTLAWRWRTQLVKHAGIQPEQIRFYKARTGKDLTEHLEAGRALAGLRTVDEAEVESVAGTVSAATATREGYGAFLQPVRISRPRDIKKWLDLP